MTLNYCLMVTGPPFGTQLASNSFQFAETLIICNHVIDAVFFYQEGVHNTNYFVSLANDEINLVKAWFHLAEKNNFTLYVCISSAMRHGVINAEKAMKLKIIKDIFDFQNSSLNKLIQLILRCDRFIQF